MKEISKTSASTGDPEVRPRIYTAKELEAMGLRDPKAKKDPWDDWWDDWWDD